MFLDTSGLFAAAHSRADHHQPARAELERLLRAAASMTTTDLVIAEFHGLSLERFGPAAALEAVTRILESPAVDVVATGPRWLDRGLALLGERAGGRLSLADAVSFLIMRDRGIETAFALDDDFHAEGFAVLPSP